MQQIDPEDNGYWACREPAIALRVHGLGVETTLMIGREREDKLQEGGRIRGKEGMPVGCYKTHEVAFWEKSRQDKTR